MHNIPSVLVAKDVLASPTKHLSYLIFWYLCVCVCVSLTAVINSFLGYKIRSEIKRQTFPSAQHFGKRYQLMILDGFAALSALFMAS